MLYELLLNFKNWDLPTLTWILPLLGLLFLILFKEKKKIYAITIGITTLPFLTTLIMFFLYTNHQITFDNKFIWNTLYFVDTYLNLQYSVTIDGLSISLLLLSCFLFLIAAIASRSIMEKYEDYKSYFILFLSLQSLTLGSLVVSDALCFFIFLEGTMLTMFFLIGRFGYLKREKAAYTYLIVGGIGSLLIMFALLFMLAICKDLEFAHMEQIIANIMKIVPVDDSNILLFVFWFLVVGLAIKVPLVPLHTWMVRTHTESPLPIVIIHAGILLKLSLYGMYKLVYKLFPVYMEKYAYLFIIAGLINLIYGALLAWRVTEGKKILAYASISHMGIIIMGFGSLQDIGIQGSLYQMISHGLVSALAFLIMIFIEERFTQTDITTWKALGIKTPNLAFWLKFMALNLLGLPGLAGFIGEVFVLTGVFYTFPWVVITSLLALILAAAYAFRLAIKPTFGKYQLNVGNVTIRDLGGIDKIMLTTISSLILFLGLWPAVLINLLKP